MSGPGFQNHLNRASADYPALYPFGTNLTKFLDIEEEETATFEERLRSSWRYMVGRVNRFAASLDSRDSVVFDVEDVMNSIVERLVEKDHLWDPSRGRYSTFVEAVMVSVLARFHEKSRTVSAPANSFSRMKTYRRREVEGTLTPSMRETMSRLENAMDDYESVDDRCPEVDGYDGVDMVLIRNTFRTFKDPLQVWVFVRRNGILGMRKMTLREIAQRLHVSERMARRINREATRTFTENIRSLKGDFDEAL